MFSPLTVFAADSAIRFFQKISARQSPKITFFRKIEKFLKIPFYPPQEIMVKFDPKNDECDTKLQHLQNTHETLRNCMTKFVDVLSLLN